MPIGPRASAMESTICFRGDLSHSRTFITLATRLGISCSVCVWLIMSQSYSYGSMGPFEPSIEDWSAYQERFTLFFSANDIKDDSLWKAIFLTTCGAATYGLFRSLAASETQRIFRSSNCGNEQQPIITRSRLERSSDFVSTPEWANKGNPLPRTSQSSRAFRNTATLEMHSTTC